MVLTLAIGLGSLFGLALVQPARAQAVGTAVFNPQDGNVWTDNGDWLTNIGGQYGQAITPNSTIDVVINQVVVVDNADSSANVTFTPNSVGVGLEIVPTINSSTGAAQASSLTTTGFADIDNGAFVTVDNNYDGLQVTPPSEFWSISSYLTVGDYTTNATLTIANGGYVTVGGPVYVGNQTTGNGAVLVTDPTSFLDLGANTLYVGDAGLGNLAVANGANISAGALEVGNQSTGNGTVLITDTDSLMEINGTAVVGEAGNGTLTIANGGNLTAGALEVGNQSTGNGTVLITDTGSTVSLSGIVVVGDAGNGALTIANGANISLTGNDSHYVALYIGNQTTGNGTLTVNGTNSVLNVAGTDNGEFGSVEVGYNGTGNLSVTNGGIVTITGSSNYQQGLQVGYLAGSNGSVLVSGAGSTLTVANAPGGNGNSMMVGGIANGSLTITNGGYVNASGFDGLASVYVSDSTLGTGAILVDGPGSELDVNNGMLLGIGTGTLTISNGAIVNLGGVLTMGYDSSGHGTALITDPGSILNASSIWAGYSGTGNLTVANGGNVSGSSLDVGVNSDSTGKVLVTDTSSKLSMTGAATVGDSGTGNLTVANGGNITASALEIGSQSTGNGTVTITDADSILDISSPPVIGEAGAGALTIANGATATFSSVDSSNVSLYVGNQTGASGFVTVNGTNSVLTVGNSTTGIGAFILGNSGNGTLTIANGGLVETGNLTLASQTGSNGTVNLNNGGTLSLSSTTGPQAGSGNYAFNFNGGTLQYTGGDATFGINSTLVNGSLSTLNSNGYNITWSGNISGNGALIKDGGGALSFTASPTQLANNTLGLYGGTLSIPSAFTNMTIGGLAGNVNIALDNASSQAVALTVGGIGASTTYSGDLTGDGNLTVVGPGLLYITGTANYTGDTLVNGGGLHINEVIVGDAATQNLTVSNGGSFGDNGPFTAGNQSTGNGNVTVTGTNSNLSMTGTLVVGNLGAGNLAIVNGASMTSGFVIIGAGANSNGAVTVDGAGSVWNMGSNVINIGVSGNGTLTISNGGNVTTGDRAFVAVNGGTNDTVTVTDPNSIWNIGSTFYLAYGSNASLTIANGGTVTSGASNLGVNGGANAIVMVEGANSSWNISGGLFVGEGGNGTLTIANGGSVSSASGFIGNQAGGNGTVLVTDPDSNWHMGSNLYIGNLGTGNLTVANGANITTAYGFIGTNAGSTGTATVTGAGSAWNLGSNDINIGVNGNGTLTISNGGNVTTSDREFVAVNFGSTGTVLVTDPNSIWSVGGTLYLGLGGNGTLTIANGGVVEAGTLRIGGGANATLNLNGGTLEVGGANNLIAGGSIYTFNFGGGTLQATNADLATSINASLVSSTTSTLDSSGYNITWSGILSGGGNLAVNGTGTLTLDGANTYTGLTTVNAGTLLLGNSLALQNSTLVVSGGNFSFGSLTSASLGGLSGSSDLALTNNSSAAVALTLGGSTDATYSGNLSGGDGLTKVGDGTQTLAGVNTYADDTTVLAGTLEMANDFIVGDAGAQNLTVSGSGSFAEDSALILGNQSTGNGTVNLNAGGTLAVGGTNGIISGAGTYAFNFDGGTLQVIGSDLTTSINASLVDTTTSMIDTNSMNATWSGNLSGGGGLDKIGLGTLTLSGTDTYTGDTAVSAGTLEFLDNSLSGTGNVTVANGAVLAFNGSLLADTGVISVDANGTVELNTGAAVNNGVTITGAGNTLISAGAGVTIADTGSTVSVNNFTMQHGATLTGADAVLTITGNSSFGSQTAADEVLYSFGGTFTVNNQGVANIYSASGTSDGLSDGTAGTTTWDNQAGASFTLNNAGSILGGGSDLFINEAGASFTSNGDGSANNLIEWSFTNNGNLAVNNGTLEFDSAPTGTGNYSIASGATMVVPSGEFNVQGNLAEASGGYLFVGASLGNTGITIGNGGNLAVSNGGNVSAADNIDVGNSLGFDNYISVDGAGSVLATAGTLTVGDSDNGTVTITNGGTVAVGGVLDVGAQSTGNGTVLVTDTNSTLSVAGVTTVGDGGNGNLTVANGGVMNITEADNNNNSLIVGNQAGSNGSVTVKDSGSILTVGNATIDWGAIVVGLSGNGDFTVANGGVVNALASEGNGKAMIVGGQAGSSGIVLVTDPSSTLDITHNELLVGDGGSGTLTVANGGTVTANGNDGNGNSLTIGNQVNSTGVVSVSDPGSSLGVGGTLNLGVDGTGSLTIANGATVFVLNGVQVAQNSDGNGTLAINSGGELQLAFDGISTGAGNGSVSMQDGIIQFVARDLTVAANITLLDPVQPNVIDTNGYNATFSGILSGNGGLEKISSGNLTLAANDTYTGDTNVLGGGLVVDGSLGGNIGNATNSSGDLYVGAASANLLIDNGASVYAGEVSFANNPGDSDVILVTDSGSLLNASESLTVGNAGFANLTVANGGNVTDGGALEVGLTSSGNGNVLVTDPTSTLNALSTYYIGDNGTGYLTLANGSTVNITGSDASQIGLNIGNQTGSSGTVTVGGASTLNVTAPIVVGNQGNGTMVVADVNSVLNYDLDLDVGFASYGNLTVANGGVVNETAEPYNNVSLYVGLYDGSNGSVTVTDAGSVLNAGDSSNQGAIYVGYEGNATLTVANGGVVNADGTDGVNSLDVGVVAGSNGSVMITDPGSTINTFNYGVIIGDAGNGTLTIANGATFSVPQGITLGNQNTGSGTINLNGGTLTIDGATGITVGSGSYAFNFGGGTLQVINNDWTTSLNATVVADTSSTLDTGIYNVTWNGLLSGGGELTKIGSGAFIVGPTTLQSVNFNLVGGTLDFGESTTTFAFGGLDGNADFTLDNDTNGALTLILGGSNTDATYSGTLSGNGGLTKVGSGNQTLVGNSTYTGDTNVLNGGLFVTGSIGNITQPSGDLYVGGNSANLTISGGASMYAGEVSFGNNPGDVDAILVTDPGSLLNANESLTVGADNVLDELYGSANLTVANGGNVTDAGPLEIGLNSDGNGTVVITDANSTLSVAGPTVVGDAGIGNLTVANGGVLTINGINGANETLIAGNISGANGSITVIDTGSNLTVNNGGMIIGNDGNATLTVTNGGVLNNYGSDGVASVILGVTANSTNDNVFVQDSGSTWNIYGGPMLLGVNGSATLDISNGGMVNSIGTDGASAAYLASSSPNSFGAVVVSDLGSTWNINYGDIVVGQNGYGFLTVSNGGTVNSYGTDGAGVAAYIAAEAGSNGNITVTDSGSTWNVFAGAINIGQGGDGSLNVYNGGVVSITGNNGSGIGSFGDDGNNTALMVGKGYVGPSVLVSDPGSELVLTNGIGIIGDNTDGQLTVQNSGNVSIYGSDSSGVGLYIGDMQGANGTVTVTDITGIFPDTQSSQLNVSGGALVVGAYGNGNLTIVNGGHVDISGNDTNGIGAYIGYGNNSTGTVMVTDSASSGFFIFTFAEPSELNVSSGALVVGYNGTGNLAIGDGSFASITGADTNGIGAYIGYGNTSTGTVTVTDVAPSFLSPLPSKLNVNVGALVVGYNGTGTLSIANGGYVNASGDDNTGTGETGFGLYIGENANSTGTVTVNGVEPNSGDQSRLNVSNGTLAVGYYGNGTLTVSGGGAASVSGSDTNGISAYIGYGANSTSSVTVTDVGEDVNSILYQSALNVNDGALVVGYNGNGTLSIANGGYVNASGDDNTGTGSTGFGLYVGMNAGSIGNVTVTGVEPNSGDQSQLNVSNGTLAVGYDGNGTLTVSGGGQVSVSGSDTNGVSAYIGYGANSTSSVTVTDVGEDVNSILYQSALNVSDGALVVGYNGNGTLNIANGGYVNAEGQDFANIGLYIGENANSTGTVTVAGLEPNSADLSSLSVSSGAVAVGYNGNGTLTVSGGGSAVFSAEDVADIGAYIGYGADSNSSIIVTDVGEDNSNDFYQSTLTMYAGALAVGYNGTGALTVANGGQVNIYGNDGTGYGLYIGENTNSIGNVSVNGLEPNSEFLSSLTMNGGAAAIGYYGNGTLFVVGGGNVGLNGEDGSGIGAYIGYDANSTSSVTVSDVGADSVPNYYQSTLNVGVGALVVGYNGTGTLTVANGGDVKVAGDDNTGTGATGFGLYIGENTNSVGNVTVSGVEPNTGDVSQLNVSNGTLAVGYYGNGTLMVSGGGEVNVAGDDSNGIGAYIGYDANSTSSVTVTDVGEDNNNNYHQSTLNVSDGVLAVGYNGNGTLTVANGGATYLYGGDGNEIGLYVGENANSVGNVTITGVEPSSVTTSLLFVDGGAAAIGYYGNGTLTVAGGGVAALSGNDASDIGAYIGYDANSTSSVTVTGMSANLNGNIYQSTLNVATGALVVGYNGTGTLTVANGGAVNVSGNDSAGLKNGVGAYVGFNAGSDGAISVEGAGSVMNVTTGVLLVGLNGAGNLSITNNGTVNLSGTDLGGFNNGFAGYIGFNVGSNGTVSVSDAGSALNVTSDDLDLGTYANGTLLITHGGQANLAGAVLGFIGGSLGNLTVSDAGSTLNDSGDAVTVGMYGNGTLTVANGANVSITGVNGLGVSIVIASADDTSGNVYVTDASSILHTSGSIQVGISGTGNFTVANGANVTVAGVDIASNALIVEGSNGTALITDANSTVTLTNGDLNLWGGGGALTIANGGTVNAEGLDNQNLGANHGVGAYIGYTAGALSEVTVTDANSTLAVTNGALVSGYDGTGLVNVVNGGKVNVSGRDSDNAGAYAGFNSDGTGTVLVDGAGSSLDSGPLVVGDAGIGLMLITNGGSVTTSGADDAHGMGAYLGWQNTSDSNVLVGANSTWTIQDAPLVVGYNGTGSLSIANGGNVTANNGNGTDQYALYVGHDSGGVGTISVDGNGTELTANGALVIGYNGTGTVDFTRDGELSVGVDSNNVSVTLGENEGGSGTLKVDGSPLPPSSGNGSNGGGSHGGGSNSNGGAPQITAVIGLQTSSNTSDFDPAAQNAIGEVLESFTQFYTDVTGVVSSLSTSAPISTGPLVIGDSGNGSLLVVNGGKVITTGADDANGFGAYIGWHSTSTSTAVVDGLGSTWTIQDAPLVVGDWGTGSLSITNGGNVTSNNGDQNDGNSLYIGLDASGVGTVTVSDPMSLLTVTNGDLQVGYNGTGSLAVTNGGAVYVEGNNTNGISAYLGYNAGSTGYVTVTDVEPNSGDRSYLEVDNGALAVGYNGTGTLAIANGGLVMASGLDSSGNGAANTGMYVGYAANSTGLVTVDGIASGLDTPSELEISNGALLVGYQGNGTLSITNGGVVNANGVDGAGNAIRIGAAANSNGNVTVSDSGSSLSTNGHNLIVGDDGTGSLTVTNGGSVLTGYLYLANNVDGMGTVSITNGGLLQVSHADGISAAYGGYSFTLDGGTLQVGSSDLSTNISISLDDTYSLPDIIDSNGSNATLSAPFIDGGGSLEKTGNGNLTLAASETYGGDTSVVEGGLVVNGSLGGNIGSLGHPSGDLYVGGNTASLLIDSGATVYAGNVSFGNSQFDTDNILVTDAGSILSAGGIMTVGVNGTANLTIANGGAGNVLGSDEDTGNGLYVGYGAGSNGSILVTDTNSTLTTTGGGYVVVGESGNGALTITNGASANLAGITLGDGNGSTGALTVNGTDGEGNISTLTTDFLSVGSSGNGTLSITNGGQALLNDIDAGALTHSNGTITVDGTDGVGNASYLQVGSLTLGDNGAGQLTISNGGNTLISSGDLVLGSNSNGFGTVLVTDANSTLTVDSNVLVGYGGSGNLTVANGGNVTADAFSFTLGFGGDTTGTVLVTGANSTLVFGNQLFVGSSGIGNLAVANGGNVTGHTLDLGSDASGFGEVLVTDVNSTLKTASDITVGDAHIGHLTVANGGNVTTGGSLLIGAQSTGNGTVLLTDANSTLNVTSDILVGQNGVGSLTVANGANATFGQVSIADDGGGTGTVLVTDANSTLDLTRSFYVGNNGHGALTVANGGKVNASGADGGGYGLYVGYVAGSVGNLMVDGINANSLTASELDITGGALVIGYDGNSSLTVSDGGILHGTATNPFNNSIFTAFNADSSGSLMVTGAGSTITEVDNSIIGYSGNSTMTVADGGNYTAENDFYVAQDSPSNSTVLVSDANSILNVGNELFLGYGGNGTLTIANGAEVAVDGQLLLADQAGSNGTLAINSNGTLEVGGANGISAGAGNYSFTMDGGIIKVAGSDLTTSLDIVTASNGNTDSIDTSGMNATFFGNISGNDAIEKLGLGNLTFTGNDTYAGGTTVNAGTLIVDGTDAGQLYQPNGDLIVAAADGSVANFTVQNDGEVEVGNMTVGSRHAEGSALVNGSELTVDDVLIVGDGQGNMLVNNFGRIFVDGEDGSGIAVYLGDNGGNSSGNLIIDDTNANLNVENGGVVVGYNGTGNLTVVDDARARLFGADYDDNSLYLGYNANSTGTARIADAFTDLEISGETIVGYGGNGTLTIANGALVDDNNTDGNSVSVLMAASANTIGNVLVTDANSTWNINNGSLVMDTGGSANLTIANGGAVNITGNDGNDVALIMADDRRDNASIYITGANSTLNVTNGTVYVGNGGPANLTIANGGNATFSGEDAGNFTTYVGALGQIYVTDANSTLITNNGAVEVEGSLTVANGGNATLTGSDGNIGLYIGPDEGDNGTVLVDGNTSSLSVTGGALVVGYNGSGNLTMDNAARAYLLGADQSGDSLYLGYNANSTGTARIADAGTDLEISGEIIVGYGGNGSLTIANGAVVNDNNTDGSSMSALMAASANTIGNVLVADANSTWNINNGALLMDTGGSANLTIANGGAVNITGNNGNGGALIMTQDSADNASVYITGPDSTLNVSNGAVYVGPGGPANLTIANGGNATLSGKDAGNFTTYVGALGQIYVTDANSMLVANNGAVEVAGGLTIANGGNATLTGSDGNIGLYIGYNERDNGTVLVDGNTSSLSVAGGALVVGYDGAGNLTIQNEGGFNNLNNVDVTGKDSVLASLYIGENAGSNGTVTITDADSLMSISGTAYVGDNGNGTLLVTNGGTLNSYGYDTHGNAFYVGAAANSTGNFAVDGASTVNVNNGVIVVGDNGTGSLNITNSGNIQVFGANSNADSLIVAQNPGSNGTVLVDGANSTLNLTGGIILGNNGTASLTVSNGGNVTALEDYNSLALSIGSTGTGSGSMIVSDANGNGTNVTLVGSAQLVNGSILIEGGNTTINRGVLFVAAGTTNATLTQTGGNLTINEAGSGQDATRIGETTATGAYNLSGGNLTIHGNFQLGADFVDNAGTGILTQTSGNFNFYSGFLSIGRINGATGIYNFEGGNFTNFNGTVGVGEGGTGTLNISGSVFTTDTALWITHDGDAESTGTLNLTGGVLLAPQILDESDTSTAYLSLNGGILRASGNSTDFISDFGDGQVTVDANGAFIDSNGYNITLSSSSLSGNGALTKLGAGNLTLATSDTYTGGTSVTAGGLAVTGSLGNATQSSGDLYVGGTEANLLIDNGGSVYADDVSFGNNLGDVDNIFVTDSGSLLSASESLAVGVNGQANLTIANGGNVTSTGGGQLGLNSGSNGTVLVTDANSKWNVLDDLYVGDSGMGSLTVANGGNVSAGAGVNVGYGSASNGTVLVTDANSTLTASNDIIVGDSGNGVLTVANGGNVTGSAALILGAANSGNGVLYITGMNATLHTGGLAVGGFGGGVVTVDNGGMLDVMGGGLILGNQAGSSGTFNLNVGGTLELGAGGITSGSGSYAMNFNGGTLQGAGNSTSSVNFTLGDGTTSNINTGGYSVTVDGDIEGGDVGNGALAVSSGGGGGSLVLNGNETFTGTTSVTSGNLIINGQHASAITVTGSSAALGGSGTINNSVTISGGGAISPGINNAPSSLATLTVTGAINWDVTNTTLTWHLSSTGAAPNASDLLNAGTLTNTGSKSATIIFDFGGTGYFDGTNYETYTLITAGNDLSQQLNLSQFQVQDVLGNYGAAAQYSYFLFANGGTELQFVLVPEPATWGLLLGGVMLLVGLRRKRRKV